MRWWLGCRLSKYKKNPLRNLIQDGNLKLIHFHLTIISLLWTRSLLFLRTLLLLQKYSNVIQVEPSRMLKIVWEKRTSSTTKASKKWSEKIKNEESLLSPLHSSSSTNWMRNELYSRWLSHDPSTKCLLLFLFFFLEWMLACFFVCLVFSDEARMCTCVFILMREAFGCDATRWVKKRHRQQQECASDVLMLRTLEVSK